MQNGIVGARMEQPGTILYADQLPDSSTAFRFEIMNNPGVELPAAGGPGTQLLYMLGILFAGCGGAGLVLKKRGRKAA